MAEIPKLEMPLRENAYDFLNYSIELSEQAEGSHPDWKHAILNIVQALELLLKERLRMAHPLLLFENVDRPTKTVSLEQALRRLQSVGIAVEGSHTRVIEKAKRWRNRMMHYEFELFVHEVKSVYALLFEFAHSFHGRELGGELHDRIRPDLWLREAALMEFFRSEFITYRGIPCVRWWPKKIQNAQFLTRLSLQDQWFSRIPYGSEPHFQEDWSEACHDCAVIRGEVHVPGCDIEMCPRCHLQLISCACDITDKEWSDAAWGGSSPGSAEGEESET